MYPKPLINQTALSIFIASIAIFITIILGIIWQGGELFWFGPAAASSAILFFYLLYINYKKPINLPASPVSTLLTLFAGWCFLSVIWSDVPAISLIHAITIGSAVIGLYCYFFITSSLLSWEQLWKVVIAAGLILFIYSCIEVYIGITAPNSLFFNKNTHAAYLNLIILPTAAYFLLAEKGRYKVFLGLSLFALTFSHALPGSRGATFGQFIGLVMIFFAGKEHFKRNTIKQFLAIYISALTAATLLTSNLFRFFKYKVENADLGRWEIWEGAINLLKDTPWYGSGVGTYWLIHPAYRHINDPSSGQNAHNDYLQYLIEAGIPGLILLLLLMLAIIYYWWGCIRNKDIDVSIKIEASGLIAGITSIGFHSFFTYNLGIYSILFLTGLLLGRFLFIISHTRSAILFARLSIRKNIFSLALASSLIILLCYFTIISTFSHLYNKAETAYSKGQITQADQLSAIALSLYPYSDRPYLLYVRIYQNILEKVEELTEQKRLLYFQRAIEYLEKAESLNPHRPNNYYFHAQLIEKNPDIAGMNWRSETVSRYQQSLKVNPRFIPATRGLTNFYISQDKISLASTTAYNALQYYYPRFEETLKFYDFAEQVFNQSGNQTHLKLLQDIREKLAESKKLT